jgi:hemolysin activation/secretion protein
MTGHSDVIAPRDPRSGRGRLMGGGIAAAVLLCGAFAAGEAPAQPAPSAPAAQDQPSLKRIVLLPRSADLAPAGAAIEGPDVDIGQSPLPGGDETLTALRRHLGQPIGTEMLSKLRLTVMKAYAQAGRPFVKVLVPPQDVSNGVLQMVVEEGRLGRLSVEGEHWFGATTYSKAIRQRPGEPIDARRLQADLDWINRSLYRRATLAAAAGEAAGTTDLRLQVVDRRPWTVSLGIDNTGTEATGRERVSFGVDWGNAFGRGDGLSYQYFGSTDFQRVRQHTANYSTDLPWRHTLMMSATYAKTEVEDGPDFNSTGTSKLVNLRYVIPLARLGAVAPSVGLGFDYKSSNNDILFGGESIFPTTSEIDQFVVEYLGSAADQRGSTSFSAAVVASPGGMTDRNDDIHFALQRPGAKARYAYGRVSVARVRELNAKLILSVRLTGQAASGPLLSSEQLALGGAYAVRGFVEQGALRDEGVIWRSEVRTKPATLSLPFSKPTESTLSAYWFLDAAAGRNRGDLAGSNGSWTAMGSTGPGVDMQLTKHASLRFNFGIPLYRRGSTGSPLQVQLGLQTVF